MAKMYPNYITHNVSDGEKELFNRFSEDHFYTRDWVILHSFNISQHVRHPYNGEADFVILIPNKGILVLEVKSHRKVIFDQNSGWSLGNFGDKRDPIKQAIDNMFSIKNSHINPYDSKVLIGWAVLFTHIDMLEDRFGNKFFISNFNSQPIIGSEIFRSGNFFQHIEYVMDGWKRGYPFSRPISFGQDLDNLIQILRPSICGVESPKSYFERIKKEIIHFDNIQYHFLDLIHNDSNKRIIFRGGAGTGKTVLAIEAFRREILNEKKTLYITFNRHINDWVSSKFNLQDSPSWVTTIENLYRHWRSTPEEYLTIYDVLIIDEAQDIIFSTQSQRYVNLLNNMLQGGLDNGRWIMFGDFSSLQSQYTEVSGQSIEEVLNQLTTQIQGVSVMNLNKNYRNPNQIVTICNQVFHQHIGMNRNDEQPAISIVEFTNTSDEIDKINNIITEITNLGFTEQDIVLLSSTSFFAAEKRAEGLRENYNRNTVPFGFDEVGIRYSSVAKFKGLEAPIIILSNVNSTTLNSSLYIGLTRALTKVYLLTNQYYPTVSALKILELI